MTTTAYRRIVLEPFQKFDGRRRCTGNPSVLLRHAAGDQCLCRHAHRYGLWSVRRHWLPEILYLVHSLPLDYLVPSMHPAVNGPIWAWGDCDAVLSSTSGSQRSEHVRCISTKRVSSSPSDKHLKATSRDSISGCHSYPFYGVLQPVVCDLGERASFQRT
jgi:hypothetical protein